MNELKSKIQVQAILRRAQAGGAFALVEKSGDEDAGSILVCVQDMQGGFTVYGQGRDENYHRVWDHLLPKRSTEKAYSSLIQRRIGSDPDLWVVVIEDKAGRHFLVEPVMDEST